GRHSKSTQIRVDMRALYQVVSSLVIVPKRTGRVLTGQRRTWSRAFPPRRLFMFNILYRCPRTVARHEHGPLHESRRLYLEHLSAHEAALHTPRGAAGIIHCAAIG